jgi:hypothetical protein
MKLAGRDRRVRAAALTAVAVGMLVPAASAGAAPAPTALTLSGPTGAVPSGGKATLTATLTSAGRPLASKSVTFLSGSTDLGNARTDSKGRAKRSVKLEAPAAFVARYTPAAADAAAYAPSESGALELAPTGRLRVAFSTYLRAGKRTVGVPGSRVRVRGSLAPAAAGAQVEISIYRKGRRVARRTLGVSSSGRFAMGFKPSRRGVYRVSARAAGAASKRARLYVVRPSARGGSRGLAVRALQRRLKDLGYVTSINGHFGSSTGRAVLAFRKVNGYARTTSAGRAVFRRLARGGGAFKVRYPKAGKHVEFDWSRQVLVLARGARPQIVLHTSSGTSATPTVLGKYRFYSRQPGYNAKGMYYSVYFVGGYAIHGYSPVPTYPASHGCLRIPIASAKRVYGWVSLGDPIYTYR